MIDELVKNWLENKPVDEQENFQDIIKGYKDFEKICSLWNTFIFMADYSGEGKYIYISPTFCNYIGVSYSEVMNKGFGVISTRIHPDDFKILQLLHKKLARYFASIPVFKQIKDSNYKFNYNFRIKLKDGNYSPVSVSSKILQFDDKGKILIDFGMIAPINYVLQTDKIVLNVFKASKNDTDYISVLQEEFHQNNAAGAQISDREWKVIELIKKGMNSKEIAVQLSLSEHTVKNHRRNIFMKTNTNKVTELLIFLDKNKL